MKPDLTHQYVARVLLAEFPHLYGIKELSFLRDMTRCMCMTDRQEDWLADLDRRRCEAVR